ncbi:histidine kinase [Myceligenerans pegani]|uniref:Histidine kinase n=1 Tax=Myceligenerans pegani TaxID=2776917 RepID=A0ABR9N0L8_9MICO|nr:histidine kinase [Myceligenerans sp. TRM 65318]MBE1877201.1 histidine kinase [Myceligenerans sp. TRM 65318]MBE3019472.1 histidine kinase [Myceligenerans sp. TRM 65318]
MRSGSVLLAGGIAVTWVVVYLVTQVIVDPPLGVGTTVVAGAVASIAVVLGYPSALRGPRSATALRRGPEPRRGTRSIVAGRTMPLRSGLTADAARRTADLLRPLLGGDAVAITDTERILAFVGPGEDHHRAGGPVRASVTLKAIASGRTATSRSTAELGCGEPDCPLAGAVAAPLMVADRVVGALVVLRTGPEPAGRGQVEDMAGILSLHLELAEADRERELAADARLHALRAQINPHFLFNVLNTIASKSRTDPEEARALLLRLSDFFRYAVRQDGQLAEFAQEYFFVRTYLTLEQARFGDRLRVRYDIDPQVLTAHVPVLTIQPLVENAVKHGLADKVDGGTVTLRARVDPLTRTTSIRVSDDGVGMAPEVLERLDGPHLTAIPDGGRKGKAGGGERDRARDHEPGDGDGTDGGRAHHLHTGVGLRNISQRLTSLFGERFSLDVRSTPHEGTVVDLRVPLR